MKVVIYFLFLIFIANISFSAGNSSCSFFGKVVDESTKEPLAGVKIQLEGMKEPVYTDFEGNFYVTNLSGSVFTIDVDYISYQKFHSQITSSKVSNRLIIELKSE